MGVFKRVYGRCASRSNCTHNTKGDDVVLTQPLFGAIAMRLDSTETMAPAMAAHKWGSGPQALAA